ncbi:MAG: penicillin acylase family protein [Acidobacteriota bacterium]|nr:MAG: penicillin acylase family protein [Acidobacteriota bacterium]
MYRTVKVGILAFTLAWAACAETGQELPGAGADSGRTVIYRDTWGVPHIYAPTAEAGAYAIGWAQAQDRPEELLKNFLRGMGELSSIEGQSAFQSDLIARIFDNYGVAERYISGLSPRSRTSTVAFVMGVNDYYRAHPEDEPEWWKGRHVDEFMVHAFVRYFLNSWSIGQGLDDLRRGGVEPNFGQDSRGSNQWAISTQRSAAGAPILVIDPHLSWFGASRFWEFRIHAGEMKGSGFTLPGFPTIGLGHNEHLAWAMTTGGPDTADVYEIQLGEEDPGSYYFDGQSRPLSRREIVIEVNGEGPRSLVIQYSHHGPVVAVKEGKAYALRTAYASEVRYMDVWWEFVLGQDYTGVEKGLEVLGPFPQNVMVADTSGNTYYQRTGRVPVRAEGYDWTRPVDGSVRTTEWEVFHKSSDLVQLLNPETGFMQNCNIPPDVMMPGSPLTPDRYPGYIYSEVSYGADSRHSNPRGARAVELLSQDDSISAAEAIQHALDVHPFSSARWLEALRLAKAKAESRSGLGVEESAALDELLGWDGELTAESTAALKYYYWREQVSLLEDGGELKGLSGRIDNFLESVGEPSAEIGLSNSESRMLVQAFADGMNQLRSDLGDLGRTYGDAFRVGRGDLSWPMGGGGRYGTSTLRSISYGPKREDGTRWGMAGQTATQVVVLSKPIKSWSATPLGQSDRADSQHFADQAEQLLSSRQMKPTWWLPEELRDHIESRTVLEDAPE